MPLSLPPEVEAILASGRVKCFPSVDISLGTGNIVHLCTELLTNVPTRNFGSIDYVSDLRDPGELNESVTLSLNRLDLRAQNVDGVLGSLLSEAQALDGAEGILSLIFRDDDGSKRQVELMYGEVTNSSDQDPEISFQLVSHVSTDGSIGGHRTLQNACFNRYKIDIRCGSLSPLSQGCDKTISGPNGCEAHLAAAGVTIPPAENNRPRHTGFIYQIRPLPGTPPAGPTGVVDGGDDFNNWWRDRQSVGEYTGRHSVPQYFVP